MTEEEKPERGPGQRERTEREALVGSEQRGKGALIAPVAILPPGFVLPSTAPIPENPAATVDPPAAPSPPASAQAVGQEQPAEGKGK